jgi:hypothetical protein
MLGWLGNKFLGGVPRIWKFAALQNNAVLVLTHFLIKITLYLHETSST